MEKERIAEGKTKIIWRVLGTDEVLIESKPILTAGDGAKRDPLEGKEINSTKTTCNCFRLLEAKGILTHFISQVDEKTFRARRVWMIPIELVARRVATGSYLKRNPMVKEGTVFEKLIIEFFLKDDARHDPLMIWNKEKNCFELYHAKKPLTDGYLEDLSKDTPLVPKTLAGVQFLSCLLEKVFSILENAWAKQNVVLVDLKIECGFDPKTGEKIVADVIDNDSWRIWPGGIKAQMKDKEVYRELTEMTPEAREILKKNYAWVARATEKFLYRRY